MAQEGEMAALQENQRIQHFFDGADLLIHDAQYTLEEYRPAKIGWGHTAVETAIETGLKSHVKRLALFHHEPVRTDQALDEMEQTFFPQALNRTWTFSLPGKEWKSTCERHIKKKLKFFIHMTMVEMKGAFLKSLTVEGPTILR